MDQKITGIRSMRSGKFKVELSGVVLSPNTGTEVEVVTTITGPSLDSIAGVLGVEAVVYNSFVDVGLGPSE